MPRSTGSCASKARRRWTRRTNPAFCAKVGTRDVGPCRPSCWSIGEKKRRLRHGRGPSFPRTHHAWSWWGRGQQGCTPRWNASNWGFGRWCWNAAKTCAHAEGIWPSSTKSMLSTRNPTTVLGKVVRAPTATASSTRGARSVVTFGKRLNGWWPTGQTRTFWWSPIRTLARIGCLRW